MREWDDAWALRPKVRDERRMVLVVVAVALLIVIAEMGVVFGIW